MQKKAKKEKPNPSLFGSFEMYKVYSHFLNKLKEQKKELVYESVNLTNWLGGSLGLPIVLGVLVGIFSWSFMTGVYVACAIFFIFLLIYLYIESQAEKTSKQITKARENLDNKVSLLEKEAASRKKFRKALREFYDDCPEQISLDELKQYIWEVWLMKKKGFYSQDRDFDEYPEIVWFHMELLEAELDIGNVVTDIGLHKGSGNSSLEFYKPSNFKINRDSLVKLVKGINIGSLPLLYFYFSQSISPEKQKLSQEEQDLLKVFQKYCELQNIRFDVIAQKKQIIKDRIKINPVSYLISQNEKRYEDIFGDEKFSDEKISEAKL